MSSASPLSSAQNSPRRSHVPLTPPLTPSSSLNDTLSQYGQGPITPIDNAREDAATVAKWTRHYMKAKREGNIRSESGGALQVDLNADEQAEQLERDAYMLQSCLTSEAPRSRFLIVRD